MQNVRRVLGLALVVSSSAFATSAVAETRSLKAAKDNLPSDVEILTSFDWKGLRTTPLFSQLFPLAMSLSGAQKGVDRVKQDCGFDLVSAVDDAALGLDKQDQGALYATMAVSDTKFTACVTALMKDAGRDVTSSKSGNEITFVTGSKSLFVMWLPGDVLVVSKDPTDEASLKHFTSGNGAFQNNAPMMKVLGEVDADAIFMGATTRTFHQKGVDLDSAAFSVTDKGGNIGAKVVVDFDSSMMAGMVASLGSGVLTKMLGPKNPPAEVDRLIKSLDLKPSGSTVTAKVGTTEKDLGGIIDWVTKGMP